MQDLEYSALKQTTETFWENYWKKTPWIELEDKKLEEIYYLGLYKLGSACDRNAPAAGLQGPWVEDFRLPVWSADFHFNINVQETYWPVFPANHPELILPLFKMVESWKGIMRENAEAFTGIKDGFLIPHAVDDQCNGMCEFWLSIADAGSTAWVAQLMWQYYSYTRDINFLRATAYPFMKGVMNVYEAMLDVTENGAYELEIGVSPEFGWGTAEKCGRNASFQLAAIHFLCRKLIEASEILNQDWASESSGGT